MTLVAEDDNKDLLSELYIYCALGFFLIGICVLLCAVYFWTIEVTLKALLANNGNATVIDCFGKYFPLRFLTISTLFLSQTFLSK
jgi:hypothetical protein